MTDTADRVSPETRNAVMERDRQCLAALLDLSHMCRNQWGDRHSPYDVSWLTIEHVRTDPGGKRRHDALHLVAMCHEANVLHWGSSTENRALINAYLWGVRAAQGF